MPDPKAPNNIEPAPLAVDTGTGDDSSKTRLGIGIVISVLANALLLQGAGVMAKNMSLNNPSPDSNGAIQMTMVTTTPPPSATPTPEATPSAKPTPIAKHHERVLPTPKPRVHPTPLPTPEHVKPTPRPTPEPVTPPSVVTPPSAITPTPPPTPPPVEKIDQKQQETAATTAAAAIAQTPEREATLHPTHTAALGSSSGPKAAAKSTLADRTPSETAFKAPAIDVAPVPHVATLQAPSFTSKLAAIFSSSNAAAAPSSANSAAPEVVTTDHTMTTSQLATHSGHISSPTARVAVIARASASATSDFVLPTSEGTVKPGTHQRFQGNSGSSGVEAIAANSAGMIVNSGGPQVVVNAPGSTAVTGPVGAFRPGKIMSNRVAELTTDHSHGAGAGSSTVSLSAGGLGGGGTASGSHLSATSGGGTGVAAFGASVGHGSLQGGNDGNISINASEGGSGRTGSGRVANSGGPGRALGSHAGTVGGGGRTDGDGGSGSVGIGNGDVHGTGNGPGYKVGALNGGVEHGTGTVSGVGPASNGGGGLGVTNSNGGNHASTGPKATKTATEVGDTTIGKTHDVQYRSPTKPAIPESLKDSTFNTNVRVRVTFGADGQSRATIVKHAGSGLSALDDAALEACSHLRFTPAYQDGSPVDSTHEFNIEFKQ